MLDHDDLKWIASTSTDLNSMLQQISRYADLARQHKGDYNYIEMLGERVEMASKTAQDLFDRVTSRILEGSAAQGDRPDPILPEPPEFKVVPGAAEASQPKDTRARGKQPPRKPTGPENKKTPAKASTEIPPEITVLNPKGNRELILLVDDEAEIAELASEMLTDEGYRVILARDGFEALNLPANRQANRACHFGFLFAGDGWRLGF